MRSSRNIFIAFMMNLLFSIIELIGGMFIGSISIVSDSIHDFGDAMSIGISYVLEKISKRRPDNKYTYGYIRYSVLGSLIMTVILVTGSVLVIYNAIHRINNPVDIYYDGMVIFGVLGVLVNVIGFKFTHNTESLNEKAISFHLLEDILGWISVLIGGLLIKITSLSIIDPILSIVISIFILYNSIKNIGKIFDTFMEAAPSNINIDKLVADIFELRYVVDVHHIHLWSLDGVNNYATMHIVLDDTIDNNIIQGIKDDIRVSLLDKYNIIHTTIEIELGGMECRNRECRIEDGMGVIGACGCGCGRSKNRESEIRDKNMFSGRMNGDYAYIRPNRSSKNK